VVFPDDDDALPTDHEASIIGRLIIGSLGPAAMDCMLHEEAVASLLTHLTGVRVVLQILFRNPDDFLWSHPMEKTIVAVVHALSFACI
jgi:hypothetical protein